MRCKVGRVLGPLHGVPLAHKDMFYQALLYSRAAVDAATEMIIHLAPK
jgi:hypothetical protein